MQNVKVKNSPSRTYSVGNPAQLTMSNLIIDNCTYCRLASSLPVLNVDRLCAFS